MWLRTYLIITGIGAFVALAMPGVVIIASFLIIPGLVLILMPTAFLYGLVFGLIRLGLRKSLSGVALNLLAAVMALALFWVVPQPGLMGAKASLAGLKAPDIRPATPIALAGNILITRPGESRCDALCAALLKTPGVTSVRIQAERGRSYTYRIVPNSTLGKRSEVTGYGLMDRRPYVPGDPLAFRRALEAEWNLMLSERKSVLQSGDVPQPDLTIAIEDGFVSSDGKSRSTSLAWSFLPSTPQRKALTISDARGGVLLRQSILSILAVRAPLSIGVSGGIENFRFGWDRKRLGDGSTYAEVPIEGLILDHSNIARGVDLEGAKARTREVLAGAIEDDRRPAGDPAFALANQWMESYAANDQALSDGDRALLLRIIADPRIESPDGLWAIVRRIDGNPTDFRRSAARRYLAASDKKARNWVNAFAGLPKGAFAVQLPEERQILATPDVSQFATGLIRRQGDRGVAAVPDLLRLLRQYSVYDPGEYGYADLTPAIEAVRDGFRIIGPEAAFARPEIEKLLTSPALERRYKRLGRQEWDTLLVVLGKPVSSLSKPENRTGTDASYREQVAASAARPFDPLRN